MPPGVTPRVPGFHEENAIREISTATALAVPARRPDTLQRGDRRAPPQQAPARGGQSPLPALARTLLDTARGARNEALYVVALHTDLRQGELLGLKWTDVVLDDETCRLSVRRSLKKVEGGLAFGPPKNAASRRSVPLNRTAAAALGGHRKRQNEERLRAPGGAWQDHDLVFPSRAGHPTDHNNLY